jgi:glycosyltransferase involved in cell wall biosynthesis
VIYCKNEIAMINLSLQLRHFLRKRVRDFDIVHIHGLYRFPPTYAAFHARQHGIPYVIRPHGSLDPYLYQRSDKNLFLKRLWERLFDLPNLNAASAIHYTAEDERRLAGFLDLKAPSFVVPNGVEWVPFERLPQPGGFRRSQGIGNRPLMLFLGRLHVKKGLDLLVPAFARVRRQIPSALLALVGPASSPSYEKEILGWIREHNLSDAVIRVPFLQGDALLRAYVDADVFVLPSYTENFGMTVVESLACETPVVISNRVNIHDEITKAEAGLVTDCDSGQVAVAVIRLLRDEQLRGRMGANGRKLVQERFTWPRIVEDLTREYLAAIARVDKQRHDPMTGVGRN